MTEAPHENDAGRPENTCPPAGALVAAFRKAFRNGVNDEGERGPGAAPKQNGTPAPSDQPSEAGPWRDMESPEAWAEETIAAFRKAAENVWGRRQARGSDAEESSPEQKRGKGDAESGRPGTHPADTPAVQKNDEAEAAPDEPSSAEGGSGEAPAEDDAERRALAFRRAFFKRRVRHEVPKRTGSGTAEAEAAALPPRPDASFLWVTNQPRSGTTAVETKDLSDERARRADAFLLRGTGADPCRLLRRIRQHAEPRVYLKPVFWRRDDAQMSMVADHVDGVWTPQSPRETLRALRERAAAINRRVRDVVEGEGRMDAGADRRVAQFVGTRTDEFAPRPSKNGGNRLLYPKLSPLLDPVDR